MSGKWMETRSPCERRILVALWVTEGVWPPSDPVSLHRGGRPLTLSTGGVLVEATMALFLDSLLS